ncbi:MAG: NADH-quinone oxidoreductase subunit C [Microthrixaceae bacterium]|nr:NADH-quinone oxidoreductase subunit C [Microthrixaceae bacterium]
MSEDAASGQTAVEDDDAARTPDVELIHGVPMVRVGTQATLHPDREEYVGLVESLRADGYWLCVDLCGVDYLTYEAPRGLPEGVEAERFEVVVGLVDPTGRRRLRVRVQVPGDDPTIDSLVAVHPGVDAYERETWDLFGITFEGHPGLSRILLPDTWEGHPLRKDSPTGDIPVQFKAPRGLRS